MPAVIALKMPMQWWRDALDEIYSIDDDSGTNERGNDKEERGMKFSMSSTSASISCWHSPIVRALCQANREVNLTHRFLQRLIDARESDLDVQQLETLQDAAQYAEETVSSLLYLTLECTGVSQFLLSYLCIENCTSTLISLSPLFSHTRVSHVDAR